MAILVLHGHHHNTNGCPLSILDNIEDRINEINTIKPEHERPIRLLLIRPIDVSELPPQAREAWKEARETWAEAREARETWAKALEAWEGSMTYQEWGEWHREHCGGVALGVCKWTPENPRIL